MKIFKILFIILLFIVIAWSLNREYHYIDLDSPAAKHFKHMTSECAKENAKECDALAISYLHGWSGVKEDKKKGIFLLEKACRVGYKPSCSLRISVEMNTKERDK